MTNLKSIIMLLLGAMIIWQRAGPGRPGTDRLRRRQSHQCPERGGRAIRDNPSRHQNRL